MREGAAYDRSYLLKSRGGPTKQWTHGAPARMAAGVALLVLTAAPAINPVLLGLALPASPTLLVTGERHTCLLYVNAELKWCARGDAAAPPARRCATRRCGRPDPRRRCAPRPGARPRSFGLNDKGQLGQDDTENRGDEPGELGTALPYINLPTGLTVNDCSAGQKHTCALLTDSGVRWCARRGAGGSRRRPPPASAPAHPPAVPPPVPAAVPTAAAAAPRRRDAAGAPRRMGGWAAGTPSTWATVSAARSAWVTRSSPSTSAPTRPRPRCAPA